MSDHKNAISFKNYFYEILKYPDLPGVTIKKEHIG